MQLHCTLKLILRQGCKEKSRFNHKKKKKRKTPSRSIRSHSLFHHLLKLQVSKWLIQFYLDHWTGVGKYVLKKWAAMTSQWMRAFQWSMCESVIVLDMLIRCVETLTRMKKCWSGWLSFLQWAEIAGSWTWQLSIISSILKSFSVQMKIINEVLIFQWTYSCIFAYLTRTETELSFCTALRMILCWLWLDCHMFTPW